jgi:hypothetical protein
MTSQLRISTLTLFAALALPMLMAAQQRATIVTYDAPGAP